MCSCPVLPLVVQSNQKGRVFLDINLILSSITALAAIVSPSVTAHINNRAAYKQQSAQMFFNAKTEAYKKFLDVSSSISYPLTTAEFQKIREVYSHTLIFSSKEVQAALHTHLHSLNSCSSTPSDAEVDKIADTRFDVVLAMQHDLESFK
nr:MAG TPA: hypothetical protein [Caudoviricetes sp.]